MRLCHGPVTSLGPRRCAPATEGEILIQVFLDKTDVLVEIFLFAKKQMSTSPFENRTTTAPWKYGPSRPESKQCNFKKFVYQKKWLTALRQELKSALKNTHITHNFNMTKVIPFFLLSNTWFLGLDWLCMSCCYLHTPAMAVKLNREVC